MRAALNAICGDGSIELVPQIRSFDAKRFQETTLHRRHQSSRSVPIEILDIDTARDLMRAVHGTPADSDAWGSRIGGTHALSITKTIRFPELPQLCDEIIALSERKDYKPNFGWVDFVAPLESHDERVRVEEHILKAIQAKDTATFSFGPPEIIDWSSFRGFRFSFERSRQPVLRPEMDIDFLVSALSSATELTVSKLQSAEVRADDEAGQTQYRWRVWDCLTATVQIDGKQYVLDDGEIFEVDKDYSRELDARLDRVATWSVGLPRANDGEAEGDYIARMCTSMPGTENVHAGAHIRVASQSRPIELCDAFHVSTKAFVHLKRDFKSKALSHLLAQGFVSADLLVRNAEFRTAVSESGRDYLPMATYSATNHTVVYGIIGRWKGRSLAEALPFFSKVQARRTFDELEAMGYSVAVASVEVGAPLMKATRPR